MPAAEPPSAGSLPAADPVSPAEAASLFADLAHEKAVVLAVSGGPDSTALAVLAARWRTSLSDAPRLLAVTVDHGLRPGSAKEARAVQRLMRDLGIAHRIMAWSGEKPVTGVQAAAREARYRLLAAAARRVGARRVVTAHTRDDQAETVLIRLVCGSGLAGLAAMSSSSALPGSSDILVVRPFLGVPKARLLATLQAAGVAFADDPSNADLRFARARYRKIMPLLAPEGLDAARLAVLARRAARADAALEAAVTAALPEVSLTHWSNSGPIILSRAGFEGLPAEIGLRLLGRAIAARGDGGPVELGKLEGLFDAVAGQAKKVRGAGLRRTLAGALVTLTEDRLTVERAPARRSPRRSQSAGLVESSPLPQAPRLG